MKKLKSCPFCGGKAKVSEIMTQVPLYIEVPVDYFCCCTRCGASTNVRKNKEEAINLWNRRNNEWLIL